MLEMDEKMSIDASADRTPYRHFFILSSFKYKNNFHFQKKMLQLNIHIIQKILFFHSYAQIQQKKFLIKLINHE